MKPIIPLINEVSAVTGNAVLHEAKCRKKAKGLPCQTCDRGQAKIDKTVEAAAEAVYALGKE